MTTPMTLGALIAALKARPVLQPVRYDFAMLTPTVLRSWRGDYSQLALGYSVNCWPQLLVGDLLERCTQALGFTFEGYKGGDYRMSPDTEIYIDNWGDCSGYFLSGIAGNDHTTTLLVGSEDD